MHKILLAAAMVLLTAVLCSCSQLTTMEIPREKRLKEDVAAYIDSIAGNEVILYEITVDSREYNEAEGTLLYDCTAHFAWDEFTGDSTNRVTVLYALENGDWALTSIASDIDPADMEGRVKMHALFTDTVDIPDAVRNALTGADAMLSDQLLDFTAEIKGVVYQFPCNFSDFTQNGWEIAEGSDKSALRAISPDAYVLVPVVNGGESVTLYVTNRTEDTIYIGQGECFGIAVRAVTGSITLPAGITEQSTAEEVLAAYGVPTTDEATQNGRRLTYQVASNSRVSFLFAADGTHVDLFNQEAQAGPLKRAVLFDNYQFGFSVDGAEYALPTRLDTMLNNGWTISSTAQSDDVIRWYETISLTLVKGAASVDVVVRNPSMGDMRLYAANITEITLDSRRVSYALVAANGYVLAMDQPADVLLGVLEEPSGTETDGGEQIVTYAGDNGRYLRLTLSDAATVAQLQAAETDELVTDVLNEFACIVNLGGNTFTLPAAAKEFKDKMWVPESGWLQAMQAGSFVEMPIENRRTETVVAYFINTGAETAFLQDCTIAGLYAGPDSANMIVGRSLAQGVLVPEAFNIFGVPNHDIHDGDTRYLVYGTSVNRFLCVRCSGDRIDALWIICFTYQ